MIVCFTATDLPQDIWNYSWCDVQNVCAWTKVGTILNQLCLSTVSLHIVLIRWNSALYPVYLLLKSHQFVCQHHLDRAICGRNVWHNNSIFSPQFHSLQMERLKIAPMRFAFHANLSTSADPPQMRRGPTRTDRPTSSVATADYFAVSRRHMRTRLYTNAWTLGRLQLFMEKMSCELLLHDYPKISEVEELRSTYIANCVLNSFLSYIQPSCWTL